MARLATDERGMTLVEIIFAAAIIGVGLAALAASIPIAAYGIHEGSHLSTATFLATQRLEQVRNARWEPGATCLDTLGVSLDGDAPPSGTCPGAGGVTFPDENPIAGAYANFSRNVRIANCGLGAGCSGIVDPDLRQVRVTVTYRPMTGLGMSAAGTTKAATVMLLVASR